MSSLSHPRSGRIAQLDSLRGIAAVTVVWHHWHQALYSTRPSWYLRPFIAGHEAVILFFVLSGYVLSLPMWTKRVSAYPEYLVRRITRIYLPYLAAAFVAGVGCYFYCGSKLPLTEWFYATWQTPLSAQVVWQQFVMDPWAVLNTAFWSLRYEMEMSLVFPFLCLLMIRMGRHSGVFLVAATILGSYLMLRTPLVHSDSVFTLYYSTFFIAGAALAREQELLTEVARRLRAPILWLVLLAALFFYCYGQIFLATQRFQDLSTMFASCGLIFLIQDPRMHLGLKSVVPEYLGRISYSLYLMHGTVLFTALNVLYGKVRVLQLALIYGFVSWIVAHVFCVFVEEPSLRMGKQIAKRIQHKRTERNLPIERTV